MKSNDGWEIDVNNGEFTSGTTFIPLFFLNSKQYPYTNVMLDKIYEYQLREQKLERILK